MYNNDQWSLRFIEILVKYILEFKLLITKDWTACYSNAEYFAQEVISEIKFECEVSLAPELLKELQDKINFDK